MPEKRVEVLGAGIDALGWDETLAHIAGWAGARESRYVTLCNVHSVVTATRNPDFARAIEQADLALPDGAPIAWAMRKLGVAGQSRISGPDLMWRCLAMAEARGQTVYFYGSTMPTLQKLVAQIERHFPRLTIGGGIAPPFGPISAEDDAIDLEFINRTGAHIVFVGLGCPKQEQWMAEHRGRVHAVMIGVGAAFDFHAGTRKRAPLWWREHGLEWFYRLCSEPRRLFARYLVTNTLFILGITRQLLAAGTSRLWHSEQS
ncbi:MAG TPA: WecB/TagA/CpsF family glycosyltransferase [Burkholderiaceae bacterium]